MREKKPVYNGYDEQYLTGAELKQLLKGHYYTTGRHHSVVLGISISDYLELIGIIDSREYRIFINDCFCRVMHGDTDRLICFFGHTDLVQRTQSNGLCENPLEKICSVCGAPMNFKEGKYGEFLGCSSYPNCKHTVKISIIRQR